MQKKQTILVVASLLVVVLSVTLAYFTAQIIGKGKDISVGSAKLQIIFTDTDGSISGTNIEPGWSTTKKFTIKNNSNATYKYNIVIQNLVNTFVTEGYLQYKITSDNNGFSTTDYVDVPKSETATDTVLGSASIDVGVTQTYTIEFIYKNDENVDQSVDMNKKLSGTIFITEKEEEVLTLYDKILEDNPTISERTDFSVTNTALTTGTLYKTNKTEDNSDVYYYSGNTTNNWVKFANFYWRIIRTNEEKSIRMLYVGTNHDTTEGHIGTSAFNSKDNDPMYVGYMYGTSGSLENNRTNTNDSTIKIFIDTWYKNNLLNNYDKYISKTAIYCNDRSIGSGTYNTSGTEFNNGSYTRLKTSKTPSYKCGSNGIEGLFENTQAIADKFSVSTMGGGNGKLTYPIALMTGDEVVYAGGDLETYSTSPYAWYYTNSLGNNITGSNPWWSLSPGGWANMGFGNQEANLLNINYDSIGGGGALPDFSADVNYYYVRPVISLKSCVKYSSGDGTPENPYTILETESGC